MSIEIHDQENKIYIVLGAPHSATSFVAKALHKLGVVMTMPKRRKQRYFKKYYQDQEITLINKAILRSVPGGRWNTPPSEEEILKTGFGRVIKKAIGHRKGNKFWGFKDTRTAFTIKKFLPHLEGDVYLICCFRKPAKVVESYKRQERIMTIDRKGIDKYNKAIIKAIKEFCEL